MTDRYEIEDRAYGHRKPPMCGIWIAIVLSLPVWIGVAVAVWRLW